MKSFLPKHAIFFELFLDLNKSLSEIVALAKEFSHNFNNFEDYWVRAQEIEHQGDIKTHEIISKLNKSFITPFDREDIYLLAHELDDIIDLIEFVIHNIHLYGITNRVPAIDKFIVIIDKASVHLEALLVCLEKQKYTDELTDLKIKIHELEDEGDMLYNNSISELFRSSSDPIYILKMKDILSGLENIMDKFQKVGDIIEGIIVKSN